VIRVARAVAAGALGVLAAGPAPVALGATKTVCVEVVVDYGDLAPGRAPSATCVTVDEGASGADVMQARAHKLHEPSPRYRSDGLLCAIDGRPSAPECAEQTKGGGYRYWSYWRRQGSGDWSYSQAGPFDTSITGAHPAEGWAWVDGGTEATRKPADVPYTQVCPTTTPTPSPPASRTDHHTRSHPHPHPTMAPTHAASTTPDAKTTGGRHTRHPHPRHSAAAAVSHQPTTTAEPTPTTVPIADPPRTHDGSTSAGTVAGVVGGVAVVAALAGGAVWRSRRT
jgi:hypothetical protein